MTSLTERIQTVLQEYDILFNNLNINHVQTLLLNKYNIAYPVDDIEEALEAEYYNQKHWYEQTIRNTPYSYDREQQEIHGFFD